MCLKMARSRGPKSSKLVGEMWVFSRISQKPNRSECLAAVAVIFDFMEAFHLAIFSFISSLSMCRKNDAVTDSVAVAGHHHAMLPSKHRRA